jgi:peptidoglycan/LPS O-acetylase OafA/YrhL
VPGVLLVAAEIELEPRLRGKAAARWVALALVPLGVLALVVSTGIAQERLVARDLLTAAGTGAIVGAPLVLQWSTGSCWRALDNPVMRWLGERSYSIYLVHLGLGYLLRDVATGPDGGDRGFWLFLLAVVPATIVAAALSYRFFELPFLRRRARWRRGRAGPPAAPGEARA